MMLIGPEKSLADEQARMNHSTRGQWDWYANHRRHIERLIVPTRRGGRICVLGAGNCNDLDLKWLLEAYGEVHLVDIDGGALERACARQEVAAGEKLKLHAPVDLTGIADRTASWKGRAVSEKEVAGAIKEVTSPLNWDTGRFDVVLSPCVLSQLLCGMRDALGKGHPDWRGLKMALRKRHLRDVSNLVAEGGRGVLVIDLASTRALPGLERAKEEELEGVMAMCIRDGKCFGGLAPRELAAAVLKEREARSEKSSLQVSAPWLWHLGFGKAFLVYALSYARLS
jgi:hypothetical protein